MESPTYNLSTYHLDTEEAFNNELEIDEVSFTARESFDEEYTSVSTLLTNESVPDKESTAETESSKNSDILIIEESSEEHFEEEDIVKYLPAQDNNIRIKEQSTSKTLFSLLFNQNKVEKSGGCKDGFEGSIKTFESNYEFPLKTLDRDDLIDELGYLLQNGQRLKKINYRLQKKMCDYYKKKKMYYVIYTSNEPTVFCKRYLNELQKYEEILRKESTDRMIINKEITRLMLEKDEKLKICEKEINDLIKRETHIGTNLKSLISGKLTSNYKQKRLIKRQYDKILELSKIRENYIKIRNSVKEMEEAIENLGNIGLGLSIFDYKQILCEKAEIIRECENEIKKLRNNLKVIEQKKAHYREKIFSTTTDYNEGYDELCHLLKKLCERRKSLTEMKKYYMVTQTKLAKLKKRAGIHLKGDLYCDFYETENKIQKLKINLENVKVEYDKDEEKIKQLKVTDNNKRKRFVNKTYKSNSSIKEKVIYPIDASMTISILTPGTKWKKSIKNKSFIT